jgi:hypothetical protein
VRSRLVSRAGRPPTDRGEAQCATVSLPLLANNVIPHGDTIAGLKYVGRRFVSDCARAERLRRRPFASRLAMQLRLAGQSAAVMRSVREAEQLA